MSTRSALPDLGAVLPAAALPRFGAVLSTRFCGETDLVELSIFKAMSSIFFKARKGRAQLNFRLETLETLAKNDDTAVMHLQRREPHP